MTDVSKLIVDVSSRVRKRAQYEAFTFSLFDGDVLVRNESHAEPAAHKYRVTIDEGVPTSCTCPAEHRYPGPCKHRVAVALRRRVVDAATEMQQLQAAISRPQSY